MFHQNNNERVGGFSWTVVALVATVLTSVSVAQKTPENQVGTEKTRLLVGRVLAEIGSLAFGVGLGPEHIRFVFAVEEDKGARIVPVKISYAFFKDEGPPPDGFFDYSKLYRLRVARVPACDETVESLSYAKNVDETGKVLPPSYVLRFLEGAPKIALEPHAVLPCYVLRPGDYEVLSQNKKPAAPTAAP